MIAKDIKKLKKSWGLNFLNKMTDKDNKQNTQNLSFGYGHKESITSDILKDYTNATTSSGKDEENSIEIPGLSITIDKPNNLEKEVKKKLNPKTF